MTREHTPRPGVTWDQQVEQAEQHVQPGKPLPTPNRAARRALARETRRAGRLSSETPCRRYDGQPHPAHPWRGFAYGPDAWCPGIPEPVACRRSTCLTPGCGDGCGYR